MPITISTGGTYSGTYTSTSTATPAVTINTTAAVILSGATISHAGRGIDDSVTGVNLTVRNCTITRTNPGTTTDNQTGRAIILNQPASVVIENNLLDRGNGIWLGGPGTLSGLKVRYNRCTNVGYWGLSNCCIQFFQADSLTLPLADIGWNHISNDFGSSAQEDTINLYQCSGTAGNVVSVHHNLCDGAYATSGTGSGYTGGGIVCGDAGGSYVTISNNTVIGTSNYGVGITGGSNNTATSNTVINDAYAEPGHTLHGPNFGQGITAWDAAGTGGMTNIVVTGNTSGWVRRTSTGGTERANWWLPAATSQSGNVALADPIDTTDEQDARTAWDSARIAAGITVGPTGGGATAQTLVDAGAATTGLVAGTSSPILTQPATAADALTVNTGAGAATLTGVSADAAGTGHGGHLLYAPTGGRWWLLYAFTATPTVLRSASSTDLITWATGASVTMPHSLLASSGQLGDNLGVAVRTLAGVDVAHIGAAWRNTTSGACGLDYVRATINAATISFATPGAASTDTSTWTGAFGPAVTIDSGGRVQIVSSSGASGQSGDLCAHRATNLDTGSAWTGGYDASVNVYGTPAYASVCSALDVGGGVSLALGDSGESGGALGRTINWALSNASGLWTPTSGASALSANTTAAFGARDWAAVARTATDVHLLVRNPDTSGAWIHRRFNGTTWTAGNTVPVLVSKAGTGVLLATDTTDVWAFVVNNAAGNTIQACKWTAATGAWDPGWTDVVATAATRTSLSGARTAVAGVVGLAWTVNTSASNYQLVTAPVTLASPIPKTLTDAATATDQVEAAGPYRRAVRGDEYPDTYTDSYSTNPSVWWHLDEPAGTLAVDSVDASPGTYVGGPTLTAASLAAQDPGKAVTFANAAVAQYVQVANTSALNPASITVEALINAASWNGNNRIVQKAATDTRYRLLANAGLLTWDLAGHAVATAALPSVGATHHVAGTYDATTGMVRLYVDGVQVAQTTGTPGALGSDTGTLAVGHKPGSATLTDAFNGTLDEVALYPIALDAGLLLAHAQAAAISPGASPILVDAGAASDTLVSPSKLLFDAGTAEDTLAVVGPPPPVIIVGERTLYYFGRAGFLAALDRVNLGAGVTPDKNTVVHDLLSGRAVDTFALRRSWTLPARQLTATQRSVLDQAFWLPGPYRLIDGQQVNQLTAQQSSGTEDTNDTTGFRATSGTLASSTTQSRTGPRSLAWTVASGLAAGNGVWTGASATTTAASDDVPVLASQEYVFSFYGRHSTGTLSLRANINWHTSAGAVISASTGSGSASSTGAWTRYTVAATAPATAAYARVEAEISTAPSTGMTIYLDDWQLEPGTSASTWVLGKGVAIVAAQSLDITEVTTGRADYELILLEL